MTDVIKQCDHCNADTLIPDGHSEETVIWCGDCIAADYQLLKVASQHLSNLRRTGFLPADTFKHKYYTWELPSSLKALKAIPKKNTIPACPPTLKNVNESADIVIGIIKDDIDSPLETKILKSREPIFCKKAYYGIDCDCGKCK